MAGPAIMSSGTRERGIKGGRQRDEQLALDLPPAEPPGAGRGRRLVGLALVMALAGIGLASALVLRTNEREAPPAAPVVEPGPVAQVTMPLPRMSRSPRPVMEPVLPKTSTAKTRPQAADPRDATLPPWRRYAVAAPIADGRPRIAVVIDDMGVDRRTSERMVALPGPLTLSYLPYGRDLPAQTAAARARGHELLLHLPMEPENVHADPGPRALVLAQSAEERQRRLAANLARFDAYVGVNNHMGSRFTADAAAMGPVLAELKARGLLFLDSRTTSRSMGAKLARDMGLPYAERDIFLDNERDAAAIRRQLLAAEAQARRKGAAIVIGHPHPETVESLSIWLSELEDKGFVLVPLTALVEAPAVEEMP